ncbi:amino acid adenylation domain-containing protein [Lentzea rhizosphaerae]|uniref:Amino acid adenylation domain-containing protein n=1 Tax=Lentzea rhizosphaerae TaxID=2041025 RepID=A0ABV8C805_9PSEU
MSSTDSAAEMFPLSPQQRYTWITAETGSGCSAVSGELTIRGPLDTGRLREALNGLVERYEIMRTTYQQVAGIDVPLQRIGAPADVVLEDVTEEDWRSRLAEPMDPAGPPLRAGLARREDGVHTLFLRLSALSADAESVGLLVESLAGLYGGAEPDGSAEEPLQYADLAEWFTQQIDDPDAEAKEHWDSLARNLGDLAELPFKRRRGSAPAGADAVEVQLPGGLREAADRDGGTVRGVVLSAWAALLGRYAPGRPLVVMTSQSGRHDADLADAIGPLARLVPVLFDGEPDASLRSLLREVVARDETAAELQGAFSPENWSTGGSADLAARASIGFAHRVLPVLRTNEVEFELSRIDAAPHADLELTCEENGESVRAVLRYRANAFARSDVADLAVGLRSVLETWIADPATPVDEVLLLPADLRRPASAPAPVGDEPEPVHERFARHALETPSAVAVVDAAGSHTYGSLHASAQALADQLVARGVGPGSLVGVLFGRSAGVLAAMTAVLETGAAYVPLDPALPSERLRLMVEDSGVEVIVTEPAHADLTALLRPDPVVLGDQRRQEIRPALARPADLAYVLYTSGTTGRPKGVLVGHQQIASYVDAIVERLGLEPGLGYAHVSTLAADLGYTVLYASLCTGGTLHLVGDDVLRNGDELGDYLTREAVDVLKITPSHLSALLQTTANPAGLIPRRVLVTGGEPLRSELAVQLAELANGCEIVNHYGPTEATVGTTAHRLRLADLDARTASVPIGSPLGAATVQVVDGALHEVPLWVPGELLIGGPGVARGYLGRPELTAERFVPDPLSSLPDGRRYRTGDLVRRLPGGELEFLGRNDDQVKISGYRVELGEIESTLRAHPDVQDCVTLVSTDETGHQRLVAFVVGSSDRHEAELHEFAAARLPQYMRPEAIVALDAFPLTANGKLDRAALLRSATGVRQSHRQRQVPPRDTFELLLAGLWTQALGKAVGVTDDFFEVGGNSLKAIRLIADIRKATGISLPVSAMVNASTIEAMATLLRSEQPGDQFRSAVPLQRSGALSPFFCVHAGGGGVLGYLPLARAVGDERPFIGLQSPGLYPGGSNPGTLVEMAARYVEEIKSHQPQGPYWIGGWCLGGIIAHEVARQLVGAGDEVAHLVLFDSDAPVDLPSDERVGDEPADLQSDVSDVELIQRFAWHYQLEIPASELESRDAEARLEHLVRLVQAKDLLPADAGLAELRQLLTVYRGNVSAAMRYIQQDRPRITTPAEYPVTLFRAKDESPGEDLGEALGWEEIYGSGVRVELVPGDHHTMMVPPQVPVLARQLADLLADTESAPGSTAGAS